MEKMLHGQGRRMFWSKPRPKSILIVVLAVVTTYYLFFSGPGAQFQVVPYHPGERTSQGEPPIVEKVLTTPNRPEVPAKPPTKKPSDSKIPEPLIIEEDEYNDDEFKIPEKVVPKKKDWELTSDEIKDWKDPTDEEDPKDVAPGYETDGKHREPGELSRLQREKDLRKEWRHHYKVTAKLASSNLIYGNTLSTLEAHEDRSEEHRAYLRDDPDVDVSFSVEKPVRFNPYPDYNSDDWKGKGNAPYVPCKGATGSIIEDPLVFKGRPHDWPAPKFGSYSLMNMDENLCWERETRLGAYGLLEQKKKMGGESEVINWENVNWGDLQRRCVHKNAKRYDMNKSRKNQYIDVYPEVAAAAKYAEMKGKIADKETTGKDRYGGKTVPTDNKAKKPRPINDGLSDGERDSLSEGERDELSSKPSKSATAEDAEKTDSSSKTATAKDEEETGPSSKTAVAEDKEETGSSSKTAKDDKEAATATAEDAKETGSSSEADSKKEESRKGDGDNADDKLQKRSPVLGSDPSEPIDEFQTFQNRSSSTGYTPETRTAILLRSYTGKKYTDNDKQNIRALVSELALKSGGQYEVFLLVQVKDKQLRVFDDPETYQYVLSEHIPPEFQGMTILWNDEMVWNIYTEMKDENERSVHTAQWLSVQKFSHDHPQFDFIWNWEMDFRFTGHYYELLDKLTTFSTKQPRKGLWERNERWYIPEYHGDYDTSFRKHIEDKYGNDTIWGAPDLPFVTSVGPKPPVDTPGEDNYEWGVGEEADVITVGPIFNPVHSNWVIANHIWGYHDSTHKAKDLPRRTTIVTQSRISRRLLDIMHIENMRGNHVASEMTPQTVALLHGFKTVYAPHPIFMDRNWDGKYLNKWFNPGQNGETGGRGSPMGWGRERRFQGSSWYYRAEPPNRMFNNWMGWSDTGIGGKKWEEKHGRPCLPSVMLHPVKDSEPTNEDHATSFELAYG